MSLSAANPAIGGLSCLVQLYRRVPITICVTTTAIVSGSLSREKSTITTLNPTTAVPLSISTRFRGVAVMQDTPANSANEVRQFARINLLMLCMYVICQLI